MTRIQFILILPKRLFFLARKSANRLTRERVTREWRPTAKPKKREMLSISLSTNKRRVVTLRRLLRNNNARDALWEASPLLAVIWKLVKHSPGNPRATPRSLFSINRPIRITIDDRYLEQCNGCLCEVRLRCIYFFSDLSHSRQRLMNQKRMTLILSTIRVQENLRMNVMVLAAQWTSG